MFSSPLFNYVFYFTFPGFPFTLQKFNFSCTCKELGFEINNSTFYSSVWCSYIYIHESLRTQKFPHFKIFYTYFLVTSFCFHWYFFFFIYLKAHFICSWFKVLKLLSPVLPIISMPLAYNNICIDLWKIVLNNF